MANFEKFINWKKGFYLFKLWTFKIAVLLYDKNDKNSLEFFKF